MMATGSTPARGRDRGASEVVPPREPPVFRSALRAAALGNCRASARPVAEPECGPLTRRSDRAVRHLIPRMLACAAAAALLTLTPAGNQARALGVPQPDPQHTPGAADPAVTRDNIESTICRSGYTRSVRHVTVTTKKRVFAEYDVSYAKHQDYEVDHLIPLELGGSNDITNLWPEPYQAESGARAKDKVENVLHALVCNHSAPLAAAQLLIANDWVTALQTVSATTGATTGSSSPPATSSPVPTSGASAGPTASRNDGTTKLFAASARYLRASRRRARVPRTTSAVNRPRTSRGQA
jgi:hypothetical protein